MGSISRHECIKSCSLPVCMQEEFYGRPVMIADREVVEMVSRASDVKMSSAHMHACMLF